MKIVLASASPRRARILSDAALPFEVLAPEIEEGRHAGESAEAMTRRLAESKARWAASQLAEKHPSRKYEGEPVIVIGADTAVELDGEIYGKPDSESDARKMLSRLSGRTHRVITAIALLRLPERQLCVEVESTRVRFASISAEEIEQYIGTGEPLGKAGGYAIQGIGGRFVESIEGCYFNVVGLPLARCYGLLKHMGWRSQGG